MSLAPVAPARPTVAKAGSFAGLGFRDNPALIFLIVLAGFLIHEAGEHLVPATYSGWVGHAVSFSLVVSVVGYWAYWLLRSHKSIRGELLVEVNSRQQAEHHLEQAVEELDRSVQILDSRTQQFEALSTAMQHLQSFANEELMCASLALEMASILPSSAGGLYLLSDNFFELVATWPLDIQLPARLLRRNWLRGLRGANGDNVSEEHWHPAEPPKGWRQTPFKAGKEFVGMIYVRTQSHLEDPTQSLILKMLVEQVNTSLSNLRLRESLTRQALRDPLTALFNRRFMEESLNREILRASRERGPLGVVMFDLDHFKKLNDTYGHAIGDLVLKGVADVTVKNVRSHDIACRYGGEEFIVILPGAPAVVAMQRAEQIRWAIKELKFDVKGKERLRVTSSFGVASFPKNATTVKALIAAADAALYESKTAGRNRVTVAD